MNLELTADEQQVLRDLVEREVGDVKGEVHHASTADYKALVKAREATLQAILRKLSSLT